MVETRMDYYIFLWYIVNMAQHVGLVVNAAAWVCQHGQCVVNNPWEYNTYVYEAVNACKL